MAINRNTKLMIHIYKFIKLIILFVFIYTSIVCCNKETFSTDRSIQLKFSADTIQFDTIFSAIGSVTKRLVVKNTYKQAIKTDIYLSGGNQSSFHLNIDGLPSGFAQDIEIAAHDSIYIFVEAMINPQHTDTPFIVEDIIIFTTNGNEQKIFLQAYGQDVFLLNNQTIREEIWSGEKPYLIYGRLTVDTLQTLRIMPGVKIYLHKEADLYVKGTLIAEGQPNRPIIFSGDRVEQSYRNIPGQWGSIILATASTNNLLQHVKIYNGTNGLLLSNPHSKTVPNIQLRNTEIYNMSYAGILAFNSNINAANCIVSNCAAYTIGLFGGETYYFNHCTFANNYSPFIHRFGIPTLVISNIYESTTYTGNINARFGNSIIYGSLTNETVLTEYENGGKLIYSFDHCLLQTSIDIKSNPEAFINVITGVDPIFTQPGNNNFRINSDSPAKDMGNLAIGLLTPTDISGTDRLADKAPDIGAFEWVEQKDSN